MSVQAVFSRRGNTCAYVRTCIFSKNASLQRRSQYICCSNSTCNVKVCIYNMNTMTYAKAVWDRKWFFSSGLESDLGLYTDVAIRKPQNYKVRVQTEALAYMCLESGHFPTRSCRIYKMTPHFSPDSFAAVVRQARRNQLMIMVFHGLKYSCIAWGVKHRNT